MFTCIVYFQIILLYSGGFTTVWIPMPITQYPPCTDVAKKGLETFWEMAETLPKEYGGYLLLGPPPEWDPNKVLNILIIL